MLAAVVLSCRNDALPGERSIRCFDSFQRYVENCEGGLGVRDLADGSENGLPLDVPKGARSVRQIEQANLDAVGGLVHFANLMRFEPARQLEFNADVSTLKLVQPGSCRKFVLIPAEVNSHFISVLSHSDAAGELIGESSGIP